VACHRTAKRQHDEDLVGHTSLPSYLESTRDLCPEVLDTNRIARPGDGLHAKTTRASRQQIFCGLNDGSQAPHICLSRDEQISPTAAISFDIDSITGFPTSLAVAKQGIRWFPTQMPVSDLQSGLHLSPRQVQYFDATGKRHQVHRPVHQVPHYTFGRLIGFEDISLYFLFPHLYREQQQSSRLRDKDFRTWIDRILLPVIYKEYSSSHV